VQNDRSIWAGALLLGLIAAYGLPKVMNKARLAARRATAITYRSGVLSTARATADPARGRPA